MAVAARPIDRATGATAWSEQFQVRAADLFSVEDVVAERVVTALALRVAAGEQARLRRRYTRNPEAYEAYCTGARPPWPTRRPALVRQ